MLCTLSLIMWSQTPCSYFKSSHCCNAWPWIDSSIQDVEIELWLLVGSQDRYGGVICLFIRNNLTFNAQTHAQAFRWKDLTLHRLNCCYCLSDWSGRPPKQTDVYDYLEMPCLCVFKGKCIDFPALYHYNVASICKLTSVSMLLVPRVTCSFPHKSPADN